MDTFLLTFYWHQTEYTPPPTLPFDSLSHVVIQSYPEHGLWFVSNFISHIRNPQVCIAVPYAVILVGNCRFRQPRPSFASPLDFIIHGLLNSHSIDFIVNQLEGEFALVILDLLQRQVAFAVDHIGNTKLYYTFNAQRIAFSSHPQWFHYLQFPLRLDRTGLHLFLSLRGVPAPYTLFTDVHKAIPGQIHRHSSNGESPPSQYWDVPALFEQPYRGTFADAQDQIIKLLASSIVRCLDAFPSNLALFLSGGVDSALLAALTKQTKYPLTAFTAGYTPITSTDESCAAAAIASNYQIPHQVTRVTYTDVESAFASSVAAMPEPVADASYLPQLILAQTAELYSPLILDGTGADNLFGGLNKNIAESYYAIYHVLPGFIRKGLLLPLLSTLPTSRRWKTTNLLRKAYKFAYGMELPPQQRNVFFTRFMESSLVNQLTHPSYSLPHDLTAEWMDTLYMQPQTTSKLLPPAFTSIKLVMPWGSLLKLSTIESQAHLSIVKPFLSPSLIEFALSLPDEYKIRSHQVKFILRQAAIKYVPADTIHRKKGNFSPPVGDWLRLGFANYLLDTLPSDGILNRSLIEILLKQQLENRKDWQLELWTILILTSWLNHLPVKIW